MDHDVHTIAASNEDQAFKVAAYLSFDEATYTGGKVPCQLLAATYGMRNISYVAKTENGWAVPVPKGFIRDLMQNGKYVCVTSPSTLSVHCVAGDALFVEFSHNIAKYRPHHQTLLTQASLRRALLDPRYEPKLAGRKRVYYADGKVGSSSNLSPKRPSNLQEDWRQ